MPECMHLCVHSCDGDRTALSTIICCMQCAELVCIVHAFDCDCHNVDSIKFQSGHDMRLVPPAMRTDASIGTIKIVSYRMSRSCTPSQIFVGLSCPR